MWKGKYDVWFFLMVAAIIEEWLIMILYSGRMTFDIVCVIIILGVLAIILLSQTKWNKGGLNVQ
jgi:hypothetical protein